MVPMVTTNAIAMMAERSGKSVPSATVSGIPDAAASVTTPRIPVHAMTVDSCQVSVRRSILPAQREVFLGLSGLPADGVVRRGLAGVSTLTAASMRLLTAARPNITNTQIGRMASTMTSTSTDAHAMCTSDSLASRRSSMMKRICRPM